MKQLKGFETAKVISGESTMLPKGGYIAQIKACEEMSNQKNGRTFSYLSFSFDIAEGEHKGHYANLYKTSTDENKKWKGVRNEFIPQEDDQYYETNLNKFKTIMTNFEESNAGFHWNWNEKELVGKYIGIIYREKEFRTNDGDVIVITEPCGFRSVEQIRSGKYKVPELKKLKEDTPAAAPYASPDFLAAVPLSDDDCPF